LKLHPSYFLVRSWPFLSDELLNQDQDLDFDFDLAEDRLFPHPWKQHSLLALCSEIEVHGRTNNKILFYFIDTFELSSSFTLFPEALLHLSRVTLHRMISSSQFLCGIFFGHDKSEEQITGIASRWIAGSRQHQKINHQWV
jgi:hypothetical protein